MGSNPCLVWTSPRLALVGTIYLTLVAFPWVSRLDLAPYIPPTDPSNELDTSNFDDQFLALAPTIAVEDEGEGEGLAAKPKGPFAAAAASRADDGVSLFDGYSYREPDAASIFSVEEQLARPHGERDHKISISSTRSITALETPPLPKKLTPVDEPIGHGPCSSDPTTSSVNLDDNVSNRASSKSNSPDGLPSPSTNSLASRSKPARQRSDIPALDRDVETDVDATDPSEAEDEGWDVVEKPRKGQQEANGARGTTLFARGVVDRYRLGLKRRESRSNIATRSDERSEATSKIPRSGSTSSTVTMTHGESAPNSPDGKLRRGLTSKFRVRARPQTAGSQSSLKALVTSSSLFNQPQVPPRPQPTHRQTSTSRTSSPTKAIPSSHSMPANLSSVASSTSAVDSIRLPSPINVASTISMAPTPFSAHANPPLSSDSTSSGLSGRAESVSPTKRISIGPNRIASSTSEDSSASGRTNPSPTKLSGGERFKKFANAGSKIFGGGGSSNSDGINALEGKR